MSGAIELRDVIDGWALVEERSGQRTLARIRPVTISGHAFIQIEPVKGSAATKKRYAALWSIVSLVPMDEEKCKALARTWPGAGRKGSTNGR